MDKNTDKRDYDKKDEGYTSWGGVAKWYDDLLDNEGTYQKEVILPNLSRILDLKSGESLVDIACGNGFFSRSLYKDGVGIVGLDISKELISLAKEISSKEKMHNIRFDIGDAQNLDTIKSDNFDKAIIVLAIQNIKDLNSTISEAYRVLKKGGKFVMVINHPSFRIPKRSDWGFDDNNQKQYRKIYSYMSEFESEIDMNPGNKNNKKITYSFHRPLQVYFKSLNKAGFKIGKLEEWISHKQSKPGKRAEEENRIRKEIPMFMAIEAIKI